MLSAYPACFFPGETGYSVIFPDLNDLSTCGETLNQALEMAVDCLAGYLYSCKMYGEEIPAPSALEEVSPEAVAKELDIDAKDAFVNMVSVDVATYAKTHFEKSVKKTLTIPTWLNDMAVQNNINCSQVLQTALKERLHIVG